MNRNWDWEDISNDMKADEERRLARKKAAAAKAAAANIAVANAAYDQSAAAAEQISRESGVGEETDSSHERRSDGHARSVDEHRRARNERYYQEPRRRGSHNGKKKRRKKRKRKSKLFRNLLLGYIAVLIILAVLAVLDVNKTMVEMRDNDPEIMVREHLQSLSDEEIAGLFQSNPKYEDPGIALANIRDYVSGGELTIKKSGKNEYEVYRGDMKLFQATLNTLDTKSKYLILNYDLLEFQSLQPATEGELYHYEITAPSSYQITVNGRDIGEPVSSVPQDGFADVKNYVTLPSTNTYVLDHLTKEPDIRVTDNGTDVSFTMAEKIDLAEDFKQSHTFTTMEEAGIDFDALGFAEKWDLFMTDDLPGDTHGYHQLSPFFIQDTAMQKKAYQWATDIDITLTSTHTLNDPPLTNQRISDIIVYDENTVSYEAYIEKVMHITRTGEEKLEKFASTIYLVKYDGEWKVANIRGDVSSN